MCAVFVFRGDNTSKGKNMLIIGTIENSSGNRRYRTYYRTLIMSISPRHPLLKAWLKIISATRISK